MKRHKLVSIGLLLGVYLCAQEPTEVTNAFLDLQRKGEFSSHISEMQVAASKEEQQKLLSEKPKCNYFVFTEERSYDIVMNDQIPERWVKREKNKRNQLNTQCAPGEFLSYQIGVFSPYQDLQEVKIIFGDLKNEKGNRIESKRMTCFNQEGVNIQGEEFKQPVNISVTKVQPFWIGIDIPEQATGCYKGKVTVKPHNAPQQQVDITINIAGDVVQNHGDDDGWRKGRLRWLNSTIGLDEQPTAPYTPVRFADNSINYLGGCIELDKDGLPRNIATFYDESNQLSSSVKNQVLAGKIDFIIETPSGIESLELKRKRILKQTPATIVWENILANKDFELTVTGSFSFEGFCRYSCEVKSLTGKTVKDIRMEVPYTTSSARYLMGLGRNGGYRPDGNIDWKWNIDKHQDKIWMGNVNAGLNFAFMDENYTRPLVNVYYALGKLNLPTSWGNGNKGGITVKEENNHVLLTAYSGERDFRKGEKLHYNFNMLITPVKPLNLKQHAEVRFYHSNSDLSTDYIPQAIKAGATAINIHHKKESYPFINYPYYDECIPDLKLFAGEAHAAGLDFRLYYTTRELTVKLPELWALRSLGGEVIHDGPGKDTRTLIHRNGPHEWLTKNLKTNFIPAWFNAFSEGKYKGDMDLSVITTPDSRWNNYYLEGLNWMIKNIGLDGIYIDDSALDRQTLQRARRILDADGKERLIDIHSWNHMNKWAGFTSSIHIYLELLPYVNRTWIGEGFGADNTADFWLVEMSGIPFGLMSETLDAHNLMRGMAYGMLPRLPWSGNPVPMWKLWDKFGMKDAKMMGYWDNRNPVECESADVKATLFQNPGTGQTMVVLSNWSNQEQTAAFHIKGKKADKIIYPLIDGVQDGTEITVLKPKSGAICIIDTNILQ